MKKIKWLKGFDPFSFYVLIIFVAGLFYFVMTLSGKGIPEGDINMKKKLTNIFIRKENEEFTEINLTEVIGDDWRKICLQEPYVSEKNFEYKTNEKVDEYHMVTNEGNDILWVFYINGKHKIVVINDFMVLNSNKKQAICTTKEVPYIYSERANGFKKYFFKKLGD